MKTGSQERKETILIVEDESHVASLLSDLLDREGYTTVWASRGDQAIDAVASITPDLVVLDLVLPDRNGIEVLSQLKTMQKDLPVVIFTGFGSRDTVRRAMEIGAFDYPTKPSDIGEFCAVARTALESKRSLGSASPI